MTKTYGIFSAHFAPTVGGVEVFTEGIARALAEHGHRIVIVTSNTAHLAPHEQLFDNVEVFRLPCRNLLKGRLPLPRVTSTYKELLRSIEAIPFDGIVVNTRFYPHSLVGLKLARKQGIRPVVIDHGADYLTLNNPLVDQAIKGYEHIITALIKRYQPACYGISAQSLHWLRTFGIEGAGVIPNAIDADAFIASTSPRSLRQELGIDADRVLIGFTGRLIPEKGLQAILAAARQLNARGCDALFLIAGEGPESETLRQANLPNLQLLGTLSSADVSRLLQETEIFCFPSRSEGFGSSLLEAAICGNYLICTDVGIARDVLSLPSAGHILRDDNQGSEIAEAVMAYCAHRISARAAATRNGEAARKLFTWEESAHQLMRACAEAQGASGKPL